MRMREKRKQKECQSSNQPTENKKRSAQTGCEITKVFLLTVSQRPSNIGTRVKTGTKEKWKLMPPPEPLEYVAANMLSLFPFPPFPFLSPTNPPLDYLQTLFPWFYVSVFGDQTLAQCLVRQTAAAAEEEADFTFSRSQ